MAGKKTEKKTEKKDLFMRSENLFAKAKKSELEACMEFSSDYKAFLDESKTEREFVRNAIAAGEEVGFVDLASKEKLEPGDKVYVSIKGKGLVMAVIGKNGPEAGFNILGSHVDSPRLDLKPNPLYEEDETAYFKTHYYGGIKKYQWQTIPLAIHGTIFTTDGKQKNITIGEKDEDPIFYITDLLPHLGQEQMSKKASEFVSGEDLNVVIGGIPLNDEDKKAYKASVLRYLNDNYDICETDLVSAEIEIVPAAKARDVGFDRAYIAAYGHDDKVCAYPAMMALLDQEKPKKTCIVLLTDKEEIGSLANSGAQSVLYENALMEIFAKSTEGGFDLLKYRQAISASKMLSADVSTAFDPKYASAFERNNVAYMSHGIKIEKYVGSRGKSGSNEATGDFVAEIIGVFDKNSIPWQTGELGKVDNGGGGTISAYMGKLGMNVIDCGVPVWSMHAPYEVISKMDLYYTYLAYKAFIENI